VPASTQWRDRERPAVAIVDGIGIRPEMRCFKGSGIFSLKSTHVLGRREGGSCLLLAPSSNTGTIGRFREGNSRNNVAISFL
jgi:hypothetical protein